MGPYAEVESDPYVGFEGEMSSRSYHPMHTLERFRHGTEGAASLRTTVS